MNHSAEGVIKFDLEHTDAPALPVEETAELRAWFPILRQTDLVGQHPERYEGYAYGNISRRHGDGFIISCTQTSGKKMLLPDDFSLVTTFDAKANRLRSKGPCSPSSEAMTHGAVYRALPAAGAVFHVHSSLIWRQPESLGLPVTDPDVEYGTPEMAECVAELLETHPFSDALVFSMGGHEDGIIACANTPETAGLVLIKTLASAYQLSRNPAWSN